MTLREIVPWKWGGLRRWETDEGPFGGFGRQMESLHREMDRLFDEMSVRHVRKLITPRDWGRELVMPDIDQTEDDKAFYLSIELPGMDETDVDITLSGRLLTIRGEKKARGERRKEGFLPTRAHLRLVPSYPGASRRSGRIEDRGFLQKRGAENRAPQD